MLETWKWNVCLVVVYNIINMCMSGLGLRSKQVCHRAPFAFIQKSFQISIVQIIIVKGSYASTPGLLLNRCFNVTWMLNVLKSMLFSEVHRMPFVAYAWLSRYVYTNSCVGLSLKIVSFFWGLRTFFTTFFFPFNNDNNNHIELSTNMRKHEMVIWHSHETLLGFTIYKQMLLPKQQPEHAYPRLTVWRSKCPNK